MGNTMPFHIQYNPILLLEEDSKYAIVSENFATWASREPRGVEEGGLRGEGEEVLVWTRVMDDVRW